MNKFILGGEKETQFIYKIKYKESEMKRLISFVSINNDFSVELFENEKKSKNNSKKFSMIFASNCERIEISADDLCEICGQMFSSIKNNGKVVKVKIKEEVFTEDNIVKIEFNNDIGQVNVYTFNRKITESFNDIEIETVCFSDKYYKESIQELRNEVNKLYKKVAA